MTDFSYFGEILIFNVEAFLSFPLCVSSAHALLDTREHFLAYFLLIFSEPLIPTAEEQEASAPPPPCGLKVFSGALRLRG